MYIALFIDKLEHPKHCYRNYARFGTKYKDSKLPQEQSNWKNRKGNRKPPSFWIRFGIWFPYPLNLKKRAFLEFNENDDFLFMFNDEKFQWSLANLTDILEILRTFKLQGKSPKSNWLMITLQTWNISMLKLRNQKASSENYVRSN